MYKFLLVVFTCLAYHTMVAQCPPYDSDDFIIVKSQEQVDELLVDFPNCTVLRNLELSIGREDFGTPINSLKSLSQLTEIEGQLRIKEPINTYSTLPGLKNLDGLQNLVALESLLIEEAHELTSLAELHQISTLARLIIRETESLSQIGMNNLHISESLQLDDLPELTTIEGISINNKLNFLMISRLPKLELKDELSNVIKIDQQLVLEYHDISFVDNVEEVGHLALTGNGVTQDLTDFASLVKINNGLRLESLEELEDLSFFKNVEFIKTQNFQFENNPKLSRITEISKIKEFSTLSIRNCPLVSDLSAFNEIIEIYALSISGTGLEDMSDFSMLEYVGFIEISFNENLLTLSGLDKLTEIGGMTILLNGKLQHLDAFSNVTTIGPGNFALNFIGIGQNNSLNSIHGLANAFGETESISIMENPQLSICHIPILCQHMLDGKQTTIEGNGPGCSSVKETEDQCNFPVFQKVFFDQNENGTTDNEPGLKIGHTVYNNTYKLFPNNDGVINLSPFDGEINLEYIAEDKWMTTTDDNFAFPNSENIDAMFIGISPTEEIYDLEVHLSFNPIICSQVYSMQVTVHNSGTTILNTDILLEGIGTYISAFPFPITADNTTATFELVGLLPGQTREIGLSYLAPDITDIPLGTILSHQLSYEVNDEANNFIYEENKSYEQELLCAYDPNDKQVFPPGIGEDNKTLKADELQYLIRFQNTGNYYAEDITIRDTLNENLDLRSFNFVSASHPISEIKMEGNALAFVFENIFLPDSIRNEPESHGFVSYSISAKHDIAEGAVIENTAHIYFDSNPAIVTNTTSNKMVTSLDNSSATKIVEEVTSVSLYPNPADSYVSISASEPINKWQVVNLHGQVLLEGIGSSKDFSIDTSDLDDGVYFFRSGERAVRLVVNK